MSMGWCLMKDLTQGNIYKTSDKELANTLVHILDPTKGITYNTFGDIREDLMYVSREIKLAYIFILGEENEWGVDVWKDIKEFENIVEEYSSNYSGINLNYIKSIDNIKEIIK